MSVFLAFFTTLPVLIGHLDSYVEGPKGLIGRYEFERTTPGAVGWPTCEVPMRKLFELCFTGQVVVNANALEVFECRHDWAAFNFTSGTFRYIMFYFFPDCHLNICLQDEKQVRNNFDGVNDHYAWFLDPRMIYTSGIISYPTHEEDLEKMQDDKLAMVCEKIGLIE
ncbi:hypothetical protein ACHAP5_007359 [Fusarium lateritium]